MYELPDLDWDIRLDSLSCNKATKQHDVQKDTDPGNGQSSKHFPKNKNTLATRGHIRHQRLQLQSPLPP